MMPPSEPEKLDTAVVIQAMQACDIQVWLTNSQKEGAAHQFFGYFHKRREFADLLGVGQVEYGAITIDINRFHDDFVPTIKAMRELKPATQS